MLFALGNNLIALFDFYCHGDKLVPRTCNFMIYVKIKNFCRIGN